MFLISSLLMSLESEDSAPLSNGSRPSAAPVRRTSPADIEKVRSGHHHARSDLLEVAAPRKEAEHEHLPCMAGIYVLTRQLDT